MNRGGWNLEFGLVLFFPKSKNQLHPMSQLLSPTLTPHPSSLFFYWFML